ncbi:minor tail protein [Arthrobacter phage Sloopyjoe]|nr:minor tail protein [Arthrobacter phage Stayer]QFG09734.1 minor tail protein [Arthrobacter phage Shiba]QFG10169.1 minor tail protein [Arthrobacter phage Egad]QFG11739.1 minor tail protein [Arthrobacter phage Salk]QFG12622.1 minor tail protein [Arthrobacter phage Michelle]QFG14395.1 minor tail protein [Arthrobacter phage StarLord]WAB09441.1 minor tail protein [Arthrobacter phage Sloopyjoe]WKW85743.1 minor tail protein [Arthrobacter phage MrAaronian]WNO27630.1 minor tail protein [Arthrobact
MEVYILDNLFRRTEVLDRYQSLIWTERFAGYGDFELVVHSTPENRKLLTPGTKFVVNESDRVQTIENYENKKDEEGKLMLKLTGRSLEQILEDRVATSGLIGLTADTDWVLTGTPGDICRQIFQKICVDGLLSPGDIIPFMTAGTTYPVDTISEPSTVIQAAIPISSVYDSIKELCDVYDLGFRLYRNQDTSQLYFNIYAGSDRTTRQTTLPAVVFSSDLDNLSNETELNSISEAKNMAYVFAKNGALIVYADGYSADTIGFNRRVVYVDATDVTEPAGATLTSILTNKGMDALAKARPLQAFDGEVSQYGAYKYGVDYRLGDLVEVRNSDGVASMMRVTEQIFVSDSEGERSYPTLSLNLFITPGSWSSWDYGSQWQDETIKHWDEA